MPCTISQEDEEYYEKCSNKELYGIMEVDSKILERVSCELAHVIQESGLEHKLSTLAKKWIQVHNEKDKIRKKNGY